MYRLGFLLGIGMLACATTGRGQTTDKPLPKAPPAALLLMRGSAADFIKRFDKNGDGTLTRDEVPPFLVKTFDSVDTNHDGKLDRGEIEQLRRNLIQRFGSNTKPTAKADVERMVDKLLQQQDANMDGKISKAEAKGRLAENFDKLDTNRDGFLDRDELRRAVTRMLAVQKEKGTPGDKAGPGPAAPDFDALDRNADGRLTRDELKGTPYASRFEEIDTNHDGQIDRREFEDFLQREARKKN